MSVYLEIYAPIQAALLFRLDIIPIDRLGFQRFFLSKYNMKGLSTKNLKIEQVPVARVDELAGELFG